MADRHDKSLRIAFFTCAADIAAFEISKRRRPLYKEIQEIKKDAAVTWKDLTASVDYAPVIVHVESQPKKFRHAFMKKENRPSLIKSQNIMPAHLDANFMENRLAILQGAVALYTEGRIRPYAGAPGREQATRIARLYAETTYYAWQIDQKSADDLAALPYLASFKNESRLMQPKLLLQAEKNFSGACLACLNSTDAALRKIEKPKVSCPVAA